MMKPCLETCDGLSFVVVVPDGSCWMTWPTSWNAEARPSAWVRHRHVWHDLDDTSHTPPEKVPDGILVANLRSLSADRTKHLAGDYVVLWFR
jgi:hypothetical protein